MYKKLFESMYNGSLVTTGPWEALVTFQQMIILADQFGVVDMTPQVIARRTGIPIEILVKGIAALEEPDPTSRSADLDGRRIDRLADHRDWGWRIVNFTYYDGLRRADERAAYQAQKYKERKTAKPEKSNTYEKDSTDSTALNNSTLSTSHPQSQSESHSQKKDSRAKAREGAWFEQFYQAYPKKRDKKRAEKAWKNIERHSPELTMKILAAIEVWKDTEDWRREKGRFVPYPATWLNGERWEDETIAPSSTKTDKSWLIY